jgi:hypothetical protein
MLNLAIYAWHLFPPTLENWKNKLNGPRLVENIQAAIFWQQMKYPFLFSPLK